MADAKKTPEGNEENAELTPAEYRKDVWGSAGGGEELAIQSAKLGTDGDSEDASDLVAAETPDTVRQISDPHIYTDAEKAEKA